ncbi:hypothetical protein BDY19DRAFT_222695 [Irpex rosettiformis]|uniref:Uncharacterized protein n=1 Tax=Irpex rosettiformis TaxID=378272 RepID=A0ACB8U0F8_9APHY|nr:hypothetical protein BDY19DRAFT_222695 [Irpex rosettiformis]
MHSLWANRLPIFLWIWALERFVSVQVRRILAILRIAHTAPKQTSIANSPGQWCPPERLLTKHRTALSRFRRVRRSTRHSTFDTRRSRNTLDATTITAGLTSCVARTTSTCTRASPSSRIPP